MKELIRFQTDRQLDTKEYEPLNEATNILEELLESLGYDVPKESRPNLKHEFKIFIEILKIKEIIDIRPVTSEDQVDAYCDIITFATGAILKAGYEPLTSITECGKEINSRVGNMVDGKFEKDLSEEAKANWYKADYSKCRREDV